MRSLKKSRDVGTYTEDLVGSDERNKEYTSTGTQCDLGELRMAPRFIATGAQSWKSAEPRSQEISFGMPLEAAIEVDTGRKEEPKVVMPASARPAYSTQVYSKDDAPLLSDFESVRFSQDINTKTGDAEPYLLIETERKDSNKRVETTECQEQKQLVEVDEIVKDLESVPDVFASGPEMPELGPVGSITVTKEREEEKPAPHITSEESFTTRRPLGDIEEGEEVAYISAVTTTSRKRLVKQKTFPLTLREAEPDQTVHVTLTSKEAEDARRSTPSALSAQRRGSSYEERRRASIEKLKLSMDDVNLSLGRRKSKARDLLLEKKGIDYHSFLIWMMFSEGELNNVKRVSATYTTLEEQKAYLAVHSLIQFVCKDLSMIF